TAQRQAADAALEELLAGTRDESLRQAEAALAVAEAQVARLEYRRERLTVRAPREGRVDALPFRTGDQPPAGAAVVSLLVGHAPHARVFVPEGSRLELAPGATASVIVEADGRRFDARLRWVASEPSFTPYFALTGDERARLVYRAEFELLGDDLRHMPGGIAVRVVPTTP
ncbi:MAG TPA: HlyD family efflux transporter periplasmic adaptor subunit, partial [Xanthomonadaceae bacterium]|nr:HlyD family efflux transporter periplasmic adaptor subunit [Xanthomonadaceae bacterium]